MRTALMRQNARRLSLALCSFLLSSLLFVEVVSAACNLPSEKYPSVDWFMVHEDGDTSNFDKVYPDAGHTNDNPGYISLAPDSEGKKKVILTVQGLNLTNLGWRVESVSHINWACDPGHQYDLSEKASPNEGGFDVTGTLGTATSILTFTEGAGFCIKLFCEDDAPAYSKQEDEPYECDPDPDSEVIEIRAFHTDLLAYYDVVYPYEPIPEGEESDPGMLVAVNDGGEYDPKRLRAIRSPILLNKPPPVPEYFTLKVATEGDGRISVWSNEEMTGTPLITGTGSCSFPLHGGDWPPSEKTFWVEGTTASSASRDVTVSFWNQNCPESRGDSIKFTIIKVDLEKCAAAFEPKGGSEDNTTTIRAYVTPNTIQGSFKFTLHDVSDEPGYCLNAPKTITGPEDTDSWKDLQFLSGQAGFSVSGANSEIAETTANNLSEATVTVKSFDYGAYGKIKVEFTPQGSTTSCLGTEEGGTKQYTNIPLDDDENYIWDSWADNAGDATDDADKNTDGSLYGQEGDGLSRYEEWRGVFYSYTAVHHRLDPDVKHAFVHNVDLIWGLFGDNAFAGLAKVSLASVGDVYDADRVINFHHGTAHVVDQHVMKLRRFNLDGEWGWGMNYGAGGTPEESDAIVDDDQVISDCPYRENDFLKYAVGHELCHGIGGRHGLGGFMPPHYPKESGPTYCVMRYVCYDCDAAGSDEAAWNAIPAITGWCCIYDQKVSDEY